jgi:broad-specificity NMP kinase
MIVVVSGLPRSGTSMMMRMLDAGGVPVLTDEKREADEDNLRGYYEDERVKQLREDASWITEAEGKAVKVISYLLRYLPEGHSYKVIFMERRIQEILASQKKMMRRRGESADEVPDDVMAGVFERHLAEIGEWLGEQPDIETIHVSYNETLQDPEPTAERVAAFLGGGLDVERMMQVVDPRLYRQRR